MLPRLINAPKTPSAIAAPLICAPALFGSQSNLIVVVVDLTDENTVIDAQHNVAASNRASENPNAGANSELLANSFSSCPSTSQEPEPWLTWLPLPNNKSLPPMATH